MTKRIISLVLALMLAVSVLAPPSFAATKPGPDAEIQVGYSTCKSCGARVRSVGTSSSTSSKWYGSGCKEYGGAHYHTLKQDYDNFECSCGNKWKYIIRTVEQPCPYYNK